MSSPTTVLNCACGCVTLAAQGRPIISVECLCSDCQSAGAFLRLLPGAPSTLDDYSATRFVLFRKDKITCEQGRQHLREHRLKQESKTRRVVAACCNTPMFLEFTNGHWLSIYGGLWPVASLPPLEIRTMTRERPHGVELPHDVPNPPTHSFAFFSKLLRAWLAMGFRVPKIDFVNGEIDGKR